MAAPALSAADDYSLADPVRPPVSCSLRRLTLSMSGAQFRHRLRFGFHRPDNKSLSQNTISGAGEDN